MTISSSHSQNTPPASSQTTAASSDATSSSQSGSSPATSGSSDAGASGGTTPAKRVISVTSITVDGITTTTITYSDGTTEKVISGSAKGADLIKMPLIYDAKGMLQGKSDDAAG